MKLFVVSCVCYGYDNRSVGPAMAVGAYSDEEVAKKIALLSNGYVTEIEVDTVLPGIKERADAFGVKLNAN